MTEGIPKKERKDSVHYGRHSIAEYKTYGEILKSEDPTRSVDREAQVEKDLSERGREFARGEAEKFFAGLNPETDDLFFVSSDQMRALETAAIYKGVAKERGFRILAPRNVRGETANRVGGGEVRTLRNLSLPQGNTFVDAVFNPASRMPAINFDAIPEDIKIRWKQAQELIAQHDYGSWGGNFYHYSSQVKKLFPEMASAVGLYETQFKNLTRLAEFGLEKAAESEHPKNVKIIAFGHENYLGPALNEYFGEHEIKNCEMLTITPIEGEEGGLHLERRGMKVKM